MLLCIYLASPLFLGMSTISFNDHTDDRTVPDRHFMLLFAERWEANRGNYRFLYLSAALLGLAVFTKYNAVFLGLGYVAFFVLRPTLRPLFAKLHLLRRAPRCHPDPGILLEPRGGPRLLPLSFH
jgi:hypothetical protein